MKNTTKTVGKTTKVSSPQSNEQELNFKYASGTEYTIRKVQDVLVEVYKDGKLVVVTGVGSMAQDLENALIPYMKERKEVK